MNIPRLMKTAPRVQPAALRAFPKLHILLLVIGCSIQTAFADQPNSLGDVHTWGTAIWGISAIPEEIESKNVTAISASVFSVALTDDGQVYLWGDDAPYPYGGAVLPIPDEISGLRVESISAGNKHVLVLTDEGEVHGWGRTDTTGRLPVPEPPEWAQAGIQAIAAGSTYSLALTADTGRLWFWGTIGGGNPVSEMPTEGGFRAISAGGNHCLALTDDGRLVAWGANTHGQTDVPEELANGSVRVKKISAGANHNLALTEDGQIWGWGSDTYDEATEYHQFYGFKDVAAGDQFSVAITVNDAILAWGYNEFDQAVPPEKLTDKDHPDFLPVIAISAGWRHALALTSPGKVATPNIGTEPFATQVNVTLSCETEGALIYYTLNGDEPTVEDGEPYFDTFAVIEQTTLKARAFKEGFIPSEIAEEEMVFEGRAVVVSDVEFGNAAIGDTVSGKIKIRSIGQLQSTIVSVSIDSDDEGVFQAYFSSMVHLDPGEEIEVNASFAPDGGGLFTGEIRVLTDPDTRILGSDPVATGTGFVPPPEGLRESGNYLDRISLEPDNSADAPMFYRIFTDEWSQWEPYSRYDELPIESPGTVRVAFKTEVGAFESEVIEKEYTIFKVTADQDLNFGEVQVGTRVSKTITLSSEGGIDLSLKSARYLNTMWEETNLYEDEETWPIDLLTGERVELTVFFAPTAVGAVAGWVQLAFESSTSRLNLPITGAGSPPPPVATPTIHPDADDGPYTWQVEIELLTATEGAEIRYTLDRSEPDESSMLYDGEPFSVPTGRIMVRAQAFKDGWRASEVAVAEYVVSGIRVGEATVEFQGRGALGLTVNEEGEGQVVGFVGSVEAVFCYEVEITPSGKVLKTGELISHADLEPGESIASIKFVDLQVAADEVRSEVIGSVGSDGSLTFDIPGIGQFSGQVDPMTGDATGMAGGYEMDLLYGDEGTCYAVVGSDGAVIMVIETPDGVDACQGQLDSTGHVVMATEASGRADLTVDADGGITLAMTPQGATDPIEFAGLEAGETGTNRLVNLSTRGHVGTGAQNLIAGFVINGTGKKPVLIRAMGPALAGDPFNVPGAMEDPRIELIPLGEAKIAENDNWSDVSDVQDLLDAILVTGAFGAETGSKDAMILTELDPGQYTARISGVSDGTGVAIVEVYTVEDLDTPDSRQVNISTRGFIGTGGSIMILGLKADGNTPRQFLIRAVGPTLGLEPFNLPGVLSDPVLTVVRSSDGTQVAEDDDWDEGTAGDAIHTLSQQLGAFALPRGSKDAVVLINLPTTSGFTVKVSGKGGETGVALAEVYEVP